MITAKEFPNKTFGSQQELLKALIANKSTLIAQKKMITKFSDSACYSLLLNSKAVASKGESENDIEDASKLKLKLVVNTTNIYDSHGDVSINGSWNKTAKESKNVLLLQEHKMTFDHIISDKVETKVEVLKWSDLGFDYKGTTEALVFYVEVDHERNEFMFEQYLKGYVKEHSAGLRYVKIEFAVNSSADWAKEEKEVWDKYYPSIVNKEDVDEKGYFWAVIEQKIIEGSAVVRGSNFATPTISVEAVSDTSKNEPDNSTQKQKQVINLNFY